MKTKLQKRLGLVQDTREVECPFGPGIFFTLRRSGHPAVKAWQEKIRASSPFAPAFLAELQKEQARAIFSGRGGKVDRAAVADRALNRIEIPADQLANLEAMNLERIGVFVEGWRGVTDVDDAEIPFTYEALAEFLSAPELMAEGELFATWESDPDEETGKVETGRRTLGQALIAWIEDEVAHDERWVEALAKNSEASSAGEPASSNG